MASVAQVTDFANIDWLAVDDASSSAHHRALQRWNDGTQADAERQGSVWVEPKS